MAVLDAYVLKLFYRYADLLKRKFSADFQQVSSAFPLLSKTRIDFGRLCPRMNTCLCPSTAKKTLTKLFKSVGMCQTNRKKNTRKSRKFPYDPIILTIARFPGVLPFSQMYPMCCIDIRNFLNRFYFIMDDHFQQPSIIDETLQKVCMANLDLLPPSELI